MKIAIPYLRVHFTSGLSSLEDDLEKSKADHGASASYASSRHEDHDWEEPPPMQEPPVDSLMVEATLVQETEQSNNHQLFQDTSVFMIMKFYGLVF